MQSCIVELGKKKFHLYISIKCESKWLCDCVTQWVKDKQVQEIV